jgi:hypothetical protein
MQKILVLSVIGIFSVLPASAQINRPETVKKKTVAVKITPAQSQAPASVYSLTAARVFIKTGNDNKESPSNMIFSFREKDGIWGKGADLFEGGSKNEFKINSTIELTLNKYPNTAASSYTLDNLHARGLYFAVYYSPDFFADAWKIEAITVTLEIKDQYGNLHPSYGNRVIQYNISNGLLTNTNWLLKATAEGISFTPSAVTITNQF